MPDHSFTLMEFNMTVEKLVPWVIGTELNHHIATAGSISQVSRAAKQRTILTAVLSIPIFQDMHRVAVNVHEVGGVSLFTNCTDDKSDCHVITNVHYCSTFTTNCIRAL